MRVSAENEERGRCWNESRWRIINFSSLSFISLYLIFLSLSFVLSVVQLRLSVSTSVPIHIQSQCIHWRRLRTCALQHMGALTRLLCHALELVMSSSLLRRFLIFSILQMYIGFYSFLPSFFASPFNIVVCCCCLLSIQHSIFKFSFMLPLHTGHTCLSRSFFIFFLIEISWSLSYQYFEFLFYIHLYTRVTLTLIYAPFIVQIS